MKIGIIVLCRYSSRRLPGKILKTINGKTLLSYILERLQLSKKTDEIVVATSTDSSDDFIEHFCLDNQIACFRGDLNNVAQRFLDCAIHYEFDYAIRINGDNLFTDPDIIDKMLTMENWSDYEFITNVPERTFPIGMSVEIVNTLAYKNMISQFVDEKYKEHVTLYMYDNPIALKTLKYYNNDYPEAKGLNLAIDTDKDFKFASAIIAAMKEDHTQYDLPKLAELIKTVE